MNAVLTILIVVAFIAFSVRVYRSYLLADAISIAYALAYYLIFLCAVITIAFLLT